MKLASTVHKRVQNNISYHFPGASSSLSEIVMTETAGDGVSCIVIVCCRPDTTCWDCWNKIKIQIEEKKYDIC